MSGLHTAKAHEVVSRILDDWSSGNVVRLLRCMSREALRKACALAGLCASDADDETLLAAYFSFGAAEWISPNDLFDERWYRARYPDVETYAERRRPGFLHFVEYGMAEGRWPNAQLASTVDVFARPLPSATTVDADAYLERNVAARAFVEAFPIISAEDHYNLYGRFLHFGLSDPRAAKAARTPVVFASLEREFDPAWYVRHYLADSPREVALDPFAHYLTVGAARSFSPNEWFDESWYRSFYPDVERAIPQAYLCGFEHYLDMGRNERRMPTFDLTASLENQMPGVTEPILVPRVDGLRDRFYREGLRATRNVDADDEQTVWFLLPQLNPDVAFGGYRACFELIRSLRATGTRVAIFCTQSMHANKAYFLYRQASDRFDVPFEDVTVLARDQDHRIVIGPRDRIVAYSVMDLRIARSLAAWTDEMRPFLLAQEYEPTYFDFSSTRAIFDEAYGVPHVAIVNTRFLERFLRKHRIGPFGLAREAEEFSDYVTFEHRINRLQTESAQSIAARSRRLLVLYARPEQHANRNLFELAVLALQNLAREGVFGREWSFVGVGALSDVEPIELGRGHRLVLRKRTSEEEYVELMASLDIGISLMYAPHPGVVAFEFATTGALVVTNTFENRSAAELEAICGNIVPCEPSLSDVERAIREALGRVHAFEARSAQALVPANDSWDDIFSADFVRRLFRLDESPRIAPSVAS